jgi:hypothetical protein
VLDCAQRIKNGFFAFQVRDWFRYPDAVAFLMCSIPLMSDLYKGVAACMVEDLNSGRFGALNFRPAC